MRARRAVVAALAAGLAVAGAAGCTSAPGTGPWPSPSPGEPTITILSETDTSISAGDEPVSRGEPGMYSELVDWWNAHEAPTRGFRLRLDVIPGGTTVGHSQMLAAAQAGEAGYDIYNLDSQWVPEFAAGGYIRSLEGKLPAGTFLAKPLASGEDASGRLYAAPFTTDVGLLYYRTDLVTSGQLADLRSFGQVMRVARTAIAGHASEGVTEGYAGQFGPYEGLTVNALEMVRGFDRDAFAADGTIADPGAVSAMIQQLADMFSGGLMPGAELSYSEPQALAAFADGQAVFMRNWPIYYPQLAVGGQTGSTSRVAGHFAVAPLPFPSVLGGQDLAISAASRYPNEALQAIEFLTSAEAERCLFAVGGFPATRTSAYAPGGSLPSGYGEVRNSPLCGRTAGRSVRIGQVIQAALRTAIPRPVTGYYTEFSAVIQDELWPVLKQASQGGSINVAKVVAGLDQDLRAASAGRAPSPSPPLPVRGAGAAAEPAVTGPAWRAPLSPALPAGRGALGAQAEQLHRVAHVGETGLRGHPLGPLLHRAALHLHAPAAGPAGQVVMVHAGPALPVERLAAGVADGVDAALLAERLQVTVHGGQPDLLSLAPQLGVDLLRAAETGQAVQRGGQGLRLPGAPGPGAAGPRAASRRTDLRVLFGLRRGHSRTVQRCPPSG
jgi:trehalose/maltose transport system substrate-binding protein